MIDLRPTSLDAELQGMGLPPARPMLSLVEAEAPPPAPVEPEPEQEPLSPLEVEFRRCSSWIAEGLEGGFYRLEDVWAAVASGKAMLWPGPNSALVTEIIDYPTARVIQAWVAGGLMDEILEMTSGVEAFGRLKGCTVAMVTGRRGWERVLGDRGYAPFCFELRRDL